jgi:hypothetical protein
MLQLSFRVCEERGQHARPLIYHFLTIIMLAKREPREGRHCSPIEPKKSQSRKKGNSRRLLGIDRRWSNQPGMLAPAISSGELRLSVKHLRVQQKRLSPLPRSSLCSYSRHTRLTIDCNSYQRHCKPPNIPTPPGNLLNSADKPAQPHFRQNRVRNESSSAPGSLTAPVAHCFGRNTTPPDIPKSA